MHRVPPAGRGRGRRSAAPLPIRVRTLTHTGKSVQTLTCRDRPFRSPNRLEQIESQIKYPASQRNEHSEAQEGNALVIQESDLQSTGSTSFIDFHTARWKCSAAATSRSSSHFTNRRDANECRVIPRFEEHAGAKSGCQDYSHGDCSLALCLPTARKIRRSFVRWNKGLLVSRFGRLLGWLLLQRWPSSSQGSVNFFDSTPASVRSETT